MTTDTSTHESQHFFANFFHQIRALTTDFSVVLYSACSIYRVGYHTFHAFSTLARATVVIPNHLYIIWQIAHPHSDSSSIPFGGIIARSVLFTTPEMCVPIKALVLQFRWWHVPKSEHVSQPLDTDSQEVFDAVARLQHQIDLENSASLFWHLCYCLCQFLATNGFVFRLPYLWLI